MNILTLAVEVGFDFLNGGLCSSRIRESELHGGGRQREPRLRPVHERREHLVI